jgi:hypothetical protein
MSKLDKSIGEEKTVVSGAEKASSDAKAMVDRPDLSPGQMLGQYKIIKLLGRGGRHKAAQRMREIADEMFREK